MERKWELIDPVTAVCYIKNAGLALDTNLILMKKRRAHRLACLVETRSSQACVLRSSATVVFSTKCDPCDCCW